MFKDVSQRELKLEILRDRLSNSNACRKEWLVVLGEYIAQLAQSG